MVLTFPSLFGTAFVSAGKTRAVEKAPDNAPPDPFTLSSSPSYASTLGSTIATSFSSIADIVKTPEAPKGFEAAKFPSLAERVSTKLRVAMKPLARSSAARPAAPPAPVPATVLFDFDEDGKADIGRWQGSNTEFKVRNSSDGGYTTATIGS
jgi:hypothetical protein